MKIDKDKLVYRKLNHGDTDLFIKLRLDFLADSHKDMGEAEKEKIKESLKRYFVKHLRNNDFIGMVCEYNGNVISTAYLTLNEKPANLNFINGKTGTLLNVYTYPEYRNNGISTNIIKKINVNKLRV